MSVEIDPNMPGMDEANARLDAMMAEESAAAAAPAKTSAEPSATSEPRAVQAVEDDAKTLEPSLTDTRATPEQKAVVNEPNKSPETTKETSTTAEPTKAEAEKSRYAKSQERLTKTWDQVNAEKTAIAAERAKIEAERAEFARRQAEFDAIRKQSEQPQFKPEDYANAAQQKKAMADHQRAQADRLESDGKFDEAEKLRKQAAKNEALSEDLSEHAENLRKNPPQGFEQKQAQYQQAKQAWTVEAAKAFPDLAKDGSAFQQTVAGHLNALAKNDPALMAHPSVIYHISRLTAAELKVQQLTADVARVPVLEKELGELKAKVKEYEALTAPASSATAARLGAQSTDNGEAELEQMAREMVTLR